jgi:hypothetical protein
LASCARVDLGEQRHRVRLTEGLPRVESQFRGGPLDVVELLDECDHPGRRGVGHEGLDKASPRVRPAADFEDTSTRVQRVVAAISVRLQLAPEVRQEAVGPIAFVRRRCSKMTWPPIGSR